MKKGMEGTWIENMGRALALGALNSVFAVAFAMAILSMGCGSGTLSVSTQEDSSASGVAAQSAGGALSSSSASGTQAYYLMPAVSKQRSLLASVKEAFDFSPFAFAAAVCPTFKSGAASGCSAGASTMLLTYNNCSFGGAMTWNGVQAIIMSTGSPTCGSFPSVGANGNLIRQYVTSASTPNSLTPGSVTLTPGGANNGMVGIVDDSGGSNLKNFNNDTLPTLGSTGGYGEQVVFANGVRSQVTVGHRMYAQSSSGSPAFDHSVYGTINISETAGSNSRTITGSIKVYHNVFQVIGTSTFNSVVHQDGCCQPVSGSITTAFSAATGAGAVAPTAMGSKAVGKSETLTFTGCGTGTLVDFNGTSTNVTLSRCF